MGEEEGLRVDVDGGGGGGAVAAGESLGSSDVEKPGGDGEGWEGKPGFRRGEAALQVNARFYVTNKS